MIQFATATTIGLRRTRQEDVGGLILPGIFGVFDGMGSYGNGSDASAAAMAGAQSQPALPHRVGDVMRNAALAVREKLAGAKGGTTGTIVGVDPAHNVMHIAHVGDSRAYRIRGRALKHLTTDHNRVWAMGRNREDARAVRTLANASKDNVLLNALGRGGEEELFVERDTRSFVPGDTILIFTDGLLYVDDERIAHLARFSRTADIPKLLCDAADEAGGRDNTTVVALHWP